jgi:23S rRNA pseudouridine1911/1915/1917 synthase
MSMQEPKVIFENGDFIVVAKPAGLLVHRVRVGTRVRSRRIDAAKREEPTLADWILARYPEVARVGDDPEFRPGIVHRLDKETSGVMVVARTPDAFAWLKRAFASRAMEKTYRALVYGVPSPRAGTIDKPIGIRSGTLKRSVHAVAAVKDAVTDYRTKELFGNGTDDVYALLEVHPRTGRTHQIRVHLASIGHPIVGDALYAPKGIRRRTTPPASVRLMLHAATLEFTGLHGERFSFEVPPPEDFMKVIHNMGKRERDTI